MTAAVVHSSVTSRQTCLCVCVHGVVWCGVRVSVCVSVCAHCVCGVCVCVHMYVWCVFVHVYMS